MARGITPEVMRGVVDPEQAAPAWAAGSIMAAAPGSIKRKNRKKRNAMKKIFAIIATVLILAGCTKETVDIDDGLIRTPISITANYAGVTKVTYTESGNSITAKWQSGDQILLVYDGYVSTLTLSSGEGTASATFTGKISYRTAPTANSMLYCFVKDANNASAVTIEGDRIIYSDAAFQSQNGTLAEAAKCNTFSGATTYGDGTDVKCSFSVNTSMCKFNLTNVGDDNGKSVTVAYKSGSNTLARATINVTGGDNLVFLAVPSGTFSGAQEIVYTCDGKTKVLTLASAQANFTAGHTYSKNIRFPGILGPFSVSSSKTIQFAPGNLQYNGGTASWRFAEHQYDYIGSWNTSSWVDLFGWGTWGIGKDPLDENTTNPTYLWSSDFQVSLNGHDDWYTLTNTELNYLLSHCTYGTATVAGNKGIIILPDNYSGATLTSTAHSSYTDNVLDAATWVNNYESHGAVFLPAAGYRHETTLYDVGDIGHYWSSVKYTNISESYELRFNENGTSSPDAAVRAYRRNGNSVRLVRKID